MAIPEPMLEKLATPQAGSHVSRLPTKSAKTNAALIASLQSEKAREGMNK